MLHHGMYGWAQRNIIYVKSGLHNQWVWHPCCKSSAQILVQYSTYYNFLVLNAISLLNVIRFHAIQRKVFLVAEIVWIIRHLYNPLISGFCITVVGLTVWLLNPSLLGTMNLTSFLAPAWGSWLVKAKIPQMASWRRKPGRCWQNTTGP